MNTMAESIANLLRDEQIIGVGTGSTVEACIDAWRSDHDFIDKQYVTSSIRTSRYMKSYGLHTLDPSEVSDITFYIDGVDQIDPLGRAIKGKGGAMTQEKLLMKMAKSCIAVAHKAKKVEQLDNIDCPLPVEVLRVARSYVARQLVQAKSDIIVRLRDGVISDHGHPILDVQGFDLSNMTEAESWLKSLTGVIETGLFAIRKFDYLYCDCDDECVITSFVTESD